MEKTTYILILQISVIAVIVLAFVISSSLKKDRMTGEFKKTN